MSLSRMIMAKRKLLRITQKDLKIALDFKSESYISKLEKNKYTRAKLPFHKLVEFAYILQIDINLFVEEAELINKEIKINKIQELHREGFDVSTISQKLSIDEFFIIQCIENIDFKTNI